MRSFDNTQGDRWQAAVLDASYGSMLLVFSPLREGIVRKAVMTAENVRVAEEQLARMDESQLRDALATAVPWD